MPQTPVLHGKINLTHLLLVVLVALLLMGAVGGGAYYLLADKDETIAFSKLDVEAGRELRLKDGRISYRSDSELVEYLLDGSGAQHTPITSPIDDYALSSKTMIAYSGANVQVRGGSMFTMTGTVGGLRCFGEYAAVLRSGASGSDSVIVLNTSTGESFDALSYVDSRVTAFDFAVQNETLYLWVVSVSVMQSVPVTSVQLYDISANGMLLYYPTFYDQLVEKLYFTDKSVFIIGSSDIVRYEVDGSREVYRVRIYGNSVTGMATTEDNAYFLLMPDNLSTQTILRVLALTETDYSAESIMTLHTNEPIVGAFMQNGGLRVVTTKFLYSYSYAGKVNYSIELGLLPVSAIAADDTRFLITTAEDCFLCSVEQR